MGSVGGDVGDGSGSARTGLSRTVLPLFDVKVETGHQGFTKVITVCYALYTILSIVIDKIV